jgi:curved DNA-binding protein CbpA
MDELDEVRLIIEELHAGLDTLPYHVFLGVPPDAAGDTLRDAFHARAQTFHPDRFHGMEDDELRDRIYAVFKRITEAYRVLGNDQTRAEYESQRKAGAARLDPTRRPAAQKSPEDSVTEPRARKYYQMALAAEKAGDMKSARLNISLALQLQPESDVLKDKNDGLKEKKEPLK